MNVINDNDVYLGCNGFVKRIDDYGDNWKVHECNQISDISFYKYKYIKFSFKEKIIKASTGREVFFIEFIDLKISSNGIENGFVKDEVIDEINNFCFDFDRYQKEKYSSRLFMQISCETKKVKIDVSALKDLKLPSWVSQWGLETFGMFFVEFKDLIVTGNIDNDDCIYIINEYENLFIKSGGQIILKYNKDTKFQKINFDDQCIDSSIHFASKDKLNDDESNVIINSVLGDFKEFININFILFNTQYYCDINNKDIEPNSYNRDDYYYRFVNNRYNLDDYIKSLNEQYPKRYWRLIIDSDDYSKLPKQIPDNISIVIDYNNIQDIGKFNINYINNLDYNLTIRIKSECKWFKNNDSKISEFYKNNYKEIQDFISKLNCNQKQINVVFHDKYTDVRKVYVIKDSGSKIDIMKDFRDFQSAILNTFIDKFSFYAGASEDVTFKSEGIWAKIGDAYKLYSNEIELNEAYESYLKTSKKVKGVENDVKFVVYFDAEVDPSKMIIPKNLKGTYDEDIWFYNAGGVRRLEEHMDCDYNDISYLIKMLDGKSKLSDYELSDKSKEIINNLKLGNDISLEDLCWKYVEIMKQRKYNSCKENTDVANVGFKFEIGREIKVDSYKENTDVANGGFKSEIGREIKVENRRFLDIIRKYWKFLLLFIIIGILCIVGYKYKDDIVFQLSLSDDKHIGNNDIELYHEDNDINA